MGKEGQDLVISGPYAMRRHPIFLGWMVARIGTGMVLGSYRRILSVACVALFSWRRIREERRLVAKPFGERDAEYRVRGSAMIPRAI